MKANFYPHNKESGLVSIFTVIFFMIFISVIIVGFIKIMGDEARQATDNDLSASALSSAQSGAEEAKRVLLYCRSTTLPPVERTRCDDALNKLDDCKAVTTQFGSLPSFGLDINADNEGVVTTNSNYEQRYTCLSVQTQTPTVDAVGVSNRSSKLIPLRSKSPFNQLVFAWHGTSGDLDGSVNTGSTGSTTRSQPEWNNQNHAALMRLEFIPYPKSGGIDLDVLSASTKTIFLLPSTVPATTIDLNTSDLRVGNPNLRVVASTPIPVNCDSTRSYACQTTINLTGIPSSVTHDFILRVSAVYRGSRIQLRLQNTNVPVDFDDVQPRIDITGRTNDVFRRIQTRVEYTSDFFMPEYALGSASPICKLLTVTDQDGSSSDGCPAP